MKSYKISASILAAIILILSVLCLLLPKQEISEAERRKLAEFPKFSIDSFLKGSFAKDFETYSTDNFPFRDAFRAIKAGVSYKVFAKSDNNDIYIKDGSMMKLGLSGLDYAIIGGGIVIVFIVSLIQEKKGSIRQILAAKPAVLRYSLIFALFLIVLLMGSYGIGYNASNFIYNQF